MQYSHQTAPQFSTNQYSTHAHNAQYATHGYAAPPQYSTHSHLQQSSSHRVQQSSQNVVRISNPTLSRMSAEDENREYVKHAKKNSKANVSDKFMDFFNAGQGYELSATNVQDNNFGTIDLYSMKRHYHEHEGKNWPIRIAVKTVSMHEHHVEKLTDKIGKHIQEFFTYDPEFVKVVAWEERGNNFKVFFEYTDYTLDRDIQARRQEKRPYQEKLMWKIIYNLTKASHFADKEDLHLHEINTQSIFYDNYQIKVIPYGLIPDQHGHDYKQPKPKDEAFQIGRAALMAGLLIPESEFNNNRISQYLEEFGRQYSGTDPERLLHFTVERLLMNPDHSKRMEPEDLYDLLKHHERHILFLELFPLKQAIREIYMDKFHEFRSFGLNRSITSSHQHLNASHRN